MAKQSIRNMKLKLAGRYVCGACNIPVRYESIILNDINQKYIMVANIKNIGGGEIIKRMHHFFYNLLIFPRKMEI